MTDAHENYCRTKKYDCSDCVINKNHKSPNCENLFEAYQQGMKDFAEKLKENTYILDKFFDDVPDWKVIDVDDINELLKEMGCEEDKK